MFCYLAIQYNIIKTKCIVDGCAYSDFAWKRGISVERSPRDTETNGCETGLCRPKRARVQWHCQEFSFGEAIASGRKSPSGVVQGALNISHSSPPDSWPVCFMVGEGAKRHFVGFNPQPMLRAAIDSLEIFHNHVCKCRWLWPERICPSIAFVEGRAYTRTSNKPD